MSLAPTDCGRWRRPASLPSQSCLGRRHFQRAYVPGVIPRLESNQTASSVVVRLMAADDRITLVIEGLPEYEGRVRLGAFMSQLPSFERNHHKVDRGNAAHC